MITALLVIGWVAASPGSAESPAIAVEREVHRIAADSPTLWPGFDPLAIPLAVYDGEKTYLFRHPEPPAEFAPLAEAPGVGWLEGRHEAVTANTNSKIGGLATATLILDPAQTGRGPADMAAIAIHEAFHVHQRARHPGWIGNEADLFAYPVDSPPLLALRRLETSALRSALAAGDAAEAACWARLALELRGRRYARMDEAFAAYERGTELNEGLASYVQTRAADRPTVDLPPEGFGPDEVRRRAYHSGSALGLLLDRFKPGWQAAFEARDKQTLDAALAAALGEGTVCRFEDAAVAEADQVAETDVAKLARERQARLARFLEAPGWRVVVEAGDGEPFWPQGFDPLNVQVVGDGRVLHTRFVRLGNAAGRMEALDAEALTYAAGPHPLFQGVRRVELTGLEEPTVSEMDGAVRLSASGLVLEFKGASVERAENALTVRVGESARRTRPVPSDLLIVPGARVGPITATTSEAELRLLFGPDLVKSAAVEVGEGFTEPGTVVFPDDATRRLEVVWRDDTRSELKEVRLTGDSSTWRTPEGISLGSTLREIERLNGYPFQLAGFGWDYGGTITHCGRGRLLFLGCTSDDGSRPSRLAILRLAPDPTDMRGPEYKQVLGDRDFSSGHPAMQTLNPRVYQMIVYLPR